jgi:hypothetical protein
MKKNLLFLLIIVAFTCSCSTKTFIPAPAKPLPPVNVTCNHYEYGIENVDKAAKCDRTTLTAFYESFNIKYYLDDMHRMILKSKTGTIIVLSLISRKVSFCTMGIQMICLRM